MKLVISIIHIFIILLLTLAASLTKCMVFNATVAKDESGNYSCIADAIAAAPSFLSVNERYYIRIKPGVYHEHVEVWANKTYLALIGDDAATTKITDNRNNTKYSIHESGTLIVYGIGFMAWNLTIENSAGAGQAVALKSSANHTAFYKCVILGYQDTLLANSDLQFYRECDIYGTTDFIFGSAKAVFQDCRIFARNNSYVTAQAKDSVTQSSGFSFQNCSVTVAPGLVEDRTQVQVYLGRPWKNHSTVIFMESFLDDVVQPAGWMDWDHRTELVYLAEYNNWGPGANTSRRVKWRGVHVFSKPYQARPFTVANYIDGCSWIPQTGIPFRSGLTTDLARI